VPGPIYKLLIDDLRTLRTNLNKDLVKGFIQKSKLLTRYPVLFTSKKEEPRQ
jgi:hypothetical protein